jgi:hypothetical protein
VPAQGSLMENMNRERSRIEVEVYCWTTERCIWHSQQFFQGRRQNVYYQSYFSPFGIDLLPKLHDCSFKITNVLK